MIEQNKPLKIVLIGDSLAGGGAEKVHAMLSVYFQNSGLEVCNCIFVDRTFYEYSGALMNLGKVNPDSNFVKRKIIRFFKFKQYIKENNFDVIIDFRMRTGFFQELLISKFVYPKNTIYTVRSGILEYYFPKSAFLSNLIYKNRNVLAVSKGIQKLIESKKMAQNVTQIYNPIFLDAIEILKDNYVVEGSNYILSVGRMNDDVKQFDKLILAYSKSNLPKQNIKLILLGEGVNRDKYFELSKTLDLLDKIIFKGSVENPFPYYKNAVFTVLSSKNEGFPNVLLESLAAQTPVVSFDCFSGPNEIIIPNKNGILVENQNFEYLTQAMNTMISDEKLYKHCKENSKASVSSFDIEIIGKQWLDLLKNTVS